MVVASIEGSIEGIRIEIGFFEGNREGLGEGFRVGKDVGPWEMEIVEGYVEGPDERSNDDVDTDVGLVVVSCTGPFVVVVGWLVGRLDGHFDGTLEGLFEDEMGTCDGDDERFCKGELEGITI